MIIARRSGAGWRIALWVEDDLGPSVVTGIEVLIARWSLVERQLVGAVRRTQLLSFSNPFAIWCRSDPCLLSA
jgi:hypothetical protein